MLLNSCHALPREACILAVGGFSTLHGWKESRKGGCCVKLPLAPLLPQHSLSSTSSLCSFSCRQNLDTPFTLPCKQAPMGKVSLSSNCCQNRGYKGLTVQLLREGSPCKLETPVSFMGRAGEGGGMGQGKRICFMTLTGTPIMV